MNGHWLLDKMNSKLKSVQTAFYQIASIHTTCVMKSQLQEPPILSSLWMFRVNTMDFCSDYLSQVSLVCKGLNFFVFFDKCC